MEAPQFFQAASFCNPQFGHQEKRQIHNYSSSPSHAAVHGGDNFAVEDLLDFSNEDAALADGGALDAVTNSSAAVDSCNTSLLPAADVAAGNRSFSENGQFSGDLGVPYEELAELEWLSNFVEESFSSEDLQKLQLISGHQARPEPGRTSPISFNPDVAVPGKARSKRSRAVPCNWTSRLIALSPPPESVGAAGAPAPTGKNPAAKKKEAGGGGSEIIGGEGRRCVHCATDKTPQWRTGPMGPKTLCNACGVRYKSGRLVPEYRPAASPTFVLTKHSNSHRKVMELRRQKEMQQLNQNQFVHHHQSVMFDGDDYLIHQHVGPDFRQMI